MNFFSGKGEWSNFKEKMLNINSNIYNFQDKKIKKWNKENSVDEVFDIRQKR